MLFREQGFAEPGVVRHAGQIRPKLHLVLIGFQFHSVLNGDTAMSTTEVYLPQPRASAGKLQGIVSSDRTLMLGWSLLAVAALIVFTAISAGRFSAHDTALLWAAVYLLTTGACGTILRARGWARTGISAEIFSQFMLANMLATLVSVVLASTDLPYRDDTLQYFDRTVFLIDWHSVITVSECCPKFLFILSYAYTSIALQPIVLLAGLFIFRYFRAAKIFCAAWVTTLTISVGIFPLVPAVGGYLHNHVAQDDTYVLVAAAWRHVEILAPVRDGTLRALSTNTLEGIITFPSFHAAAAVLLAWGFWHLHYLRWPALALNLAMLASTPFVGGHYIVDVATGSAIAVLVLTAVTKWQRGIADQEPLGDQISSRARERIRSPPVSPMSATTLPIAVEVCTPR